MVQKQHLSHFLGQGLEYSPEQLPGKMELLLRGGAERSRSSNQTIVFPALLKVIGQQLETGSGEGIRESTNKVCHLKMQYNT